jgi:GT2 family glycosyltransferase
MSEKTANKSVPAISVVLATKGTKSMLLEKCIKSLQKQTFEKFEIVLVYSIYPKRLKGLFEACNIITLKENSSTLGAARNLGVKHAKGDLVAFIDDDCEAPENWLRRIYLTFQQYPSLSCLGGPHLTPPEECTNSPLKFAQGSFNESFMQRIFIDRSAVGKIAGCNVAYRKEVFDKIGCLDEALKSGEDWELHIRLAENGYHMRFEPNIFVWHHRQGLKHTFWDSSRMVPFYLSLKTLKYAKYESKFSRFYIANFLCLLLFITLFISLFVFSLLLSFSLLGYFIFTMVRARAPLAILVTLASLMGFYFGLFKYVASKLYH